MDPQGNYEGWFSSKPFQIIPRKPTRKKGHTGVSILGFIKRASFWFPFAKPKAGALKHRHLHLMKPWKNWFCHLSPNSPCDTAAPISGLLLACRHKCRFLKSAKHSLAPYLKDLNSKLTRSPSFTPRPLEKPEGKVAKSLLYLESSNSNFLIESATRVACELSADVAR